MDLARKKKNSSITEENTIMEVSAKSNVPLELSDIEGLMEIITSFQNLTHVIGGFCAQNEEKSFC